MMLRGLKVALVGPLPPPSGGMANQTRQLGELLVKEGAVVTVVQVNAPYPLKALARIPILRAATRLLPYVVRLFRVIGTADIVHVMANSGWSWHLFAAPAIVVARWRGVPSVVNYRGGEAAAFLAGSHALVCFGLRRSSALVVPSRYLQEIFAAHRIRSDVVPNIIDLERFRPRTEPRSPNAPRILVPRNLEPIYDVDTALRALRILREALPQVRMTVAGSGPERERLERLASELGVADAVEFCGRVERDAMASLYRDADVVVNPSLVDNMPNSVLEALASGVPVVSTNVGGVPYIVRDGASALLVPPGAPAELAAAVRRVLDDAALAAALRENGLRDVRQYAWPHVRDQWAQVYRSALAGSRIAMKTA
jgi:glycosyltransferase involved in cell wall biosynthesis